jgi:membrane-bound ClpP family serine protease
MWGRSLRAEMTASAMALKLLAKKNNKLVVVLETPGGFAEVVRRVSDTFRQHYQVVDFCVPSHAMSAKTILQYWRCLETLFIWIIILC